MGDVASYRDLKVWSRGVALSLRVYGVTRSFPDDERFGLVSQLRRCSVSIPSNLAEGHARRSTKDFLRFLTIARGSLAELETQLLIAHELGFLGPAEHAELASLCDDESRMLTGLRKTLERRLRD